MKRRRGNGRSNTPRRSGIKDAHRESAHFRVRAIAGFMLIVVCLAALAARFAWLQIVRHDEFSARSDNNRISVRSIAPARGLIYDRNGVLLAENAAAFRLEVVPEHVHDMQHMLDALGAVVALSDDDIERFNATRRIKHAFESIPLRFKLSEDEIARFSTERWQFPGVSLVPYLTRVYPHAEEFAHVVGYVARIDAAEAANLDADRYAGTTHIGKSGIERSYEDELHGEPGYEQVEVNVDQHPLRVIRSVAPTPGKNLYLSIDARLQHVAMQAFDGRAGAGVALDPRNGEVLVMVSLPSFNPNLFVNGISQSDYSALINAPDKPLLNRAIAGGFTPGSTVKPFLALGGLELGLRKPEDTVFSTGEFFIPGHARAYRDDKRGGQGRVDLVQAISHSVNTYFYSLALDMGIDRFSAWMGNFGFGQPTGIDLRGEASGVLPSREWKRAHFNQVFFPGETVIAGIGQGYWVVTPIQLAQALATLADKGVRHQPHLLRAIQDGINAAPAMLPIATPQPSFLHNPANWIPVQQGMVAVVNGGGTANGLGDGFPYTIAGKTGTAERYSRTDEAWQNIMTVSIEHHEVLFEAFAPADAPRIAVVVALHAGHTGAHDAAPIVRTILDAWLKYDDDKGQAP
ncbi:MAG: penicillin-binding protein 2 [Rudaea sp.]